MMFYAVHSVNYDQQKPHKRIPVITQPNENRTNVKTVLKLRAEEEKNKQKEDSFNQKQGTKVK